VYSYRTSRLQGLDGSSGQGQSSRDVLKSLSDIFKLMVNWWGAEER
jgi:hypothetical protein